ncbi:MAG: squalene--hopene cyclase [Verrucomicrobium sp.]|nr:squalene--hopene cyclase [Verrucomicrobium sp.]
MKSLFHTLLLGASLLGASTLRAQDPSLRFGGQIPPEVVTVYERGLAWLTAAQSPEGSWKGGNEGCGVDGICLMAFLASGEDPNYGVHAPVIRRAIRSIIQRQDEKTGYMPNSMYHHGFAMLALAEAYGTVDENLLWEGAKPVRSLAQTLDLAIRCSATSQGNNRWGGWRYSPDATDADTSVTGAMLMGLFACRNAGLEVADTVIDSAMDYMRRSTGKDGSVAYSGGFGGMGGSMNLTAIATLVGAISRTKDTEQYQASLKRLKENLEHRETSYAEYFRYYMAQALFQADYDSWQKWNAAKVRELHGLQRDDGAIGSSAYSTGMSLLGLALNFRFLPIYER